MARTRDGAAVTAKPDTLCHGCVTQLQGCLEQLPVIRKVLRLFLGATPVTAHATKVNSTPAPSVPLNLRVLDLIAEIGDVVARVGGANTRVSDLIRKPAEKFTVWKDGRLRKVDIDGVDRALAIGGVWRKADGIIGMSRVWQRRIAKCPRCNLHTLGSFSGSDSVQCSSCGGVMTRSEYERVCLIVAGRG